MSRAATFVAVATTEGEGGRAGVTISSLTSVSADGEHAVASGLHPPPVARGDRDPEEPGVLRQPSGRETSRTIANLFAGRGGDDHADRFDRVDLGGRAAGPAHADRGDRQFRMPPCHRAFVGDASHHRRARRIGAAVGRPDRPCSTASGPIAGYTSAAEIVQMLTYLPQQAGAVIEDPGTKTGPAQHGGNND